MSLLSIFRKRRTNHSKIKTAVRAGIESLEARTLFAAAPAGFQHVDTIELDGASAQHVIRDDIFLRSSAQYFFIARGAHQIAENPLRLADAQYYQNSSGAWVKGGNAHLRVNGVNWWTAAPGEQYVYTRQVAGNNANLDTWISDSYYGDNDGTMTLEVYTSLPTVHVHSPIDADETDQTHGSFVVTRSGGNLSQSLTVTLSHHAFGKSYTYADWLTPVTSVTFAPGQTDYVLPVHVWDDRYAEPNGDQLQTTVAQGNGYQVVGDGITVNIWDNDMGGPGGGGTLPPGGGGGIPEDPSEGPNSWVDIGVGGWGWWYAGQQSGQYPSYGSTDGGDGLTTGGFLRLNSDFDESSDWSGTGAPPRDFEKYGIAPGDGEVAPLWLGMWTDGSTHDGDWTLTWDQSKAKVWAADFDGDGNFTGYSERSSGWGGRLSEIDDYYGTWWYGWGLGAWVEPIDESSSLDDLAFEAVFAPDEGDAVQDTAKYTVIDADLDVDSDNSNGFSAPDRSNLEDYLEDRGQSANGDVQPGKVLVVNDGDKDNDGIPDYADGFNWDGLPDTDDDEVAGLTLTPVVLKIPDAIDLATATLHFNYDASDPNYESLRTGAGTLEDPFVYHAELGGLRLWTKDATEERDGRSIADGGDWIDPTDPVAASALFGQDRQVTLWVEAVQASLLQGDQWISVGIDPDGSGGLVGSVAADSVRMTAIGYHFVTPDGLMPSGALGVSNARPVVELEHSGVTVSADGTASITISGYIRDALLDNLPESAALDITGARVYLSGVDTDITMEISRVAAEPPTPWRMSPYKGELTPIPFTFAAGGRQVIRVETDPNPAGLMGYAEIVVDFNQQVASVTTGTTAGLVLPTFLTLDADLDESSVDVIEYRTDTETSGPILFTETGENTGVFESGPVFGDQFRIELVSFAGLTSSPDVMEILFHATHADGQSFTESRMYVETSAETGVFGYTVNEPGRPIVRKDVAYSVAAVTPGDRSDPGTYNPSTLLITGPAGLDVEALTSTLGGNEYDFQWNDDLGGYVLSSGGEAIVGATFHDPDADVDAFFFWNPDSSTIERVDAESGRISADLKFSGQLIGADEMSMTRIELVDAESQPVGTPRRVDIDLLLALLAGDSNVEIPADAKFKLRHHGGRLNATVMVTSTETGESFVLAGPEADTDGLTATRVGELVEAGEYLESLHWIIVYSPSSTASALTDTQWDDLAAMGYYAVHNPEPKAADVNKAAEVVENQIDHHLFNKFRDSPRAKFWTDLFGPDFDTDDFTVKVDVTKHRGQITPRSNEVWRKFVDDNWDELQQLKAQGKSVKSLQRKAVNQMFSLADEFDLNPLESRKYRNAAAEVGSKADELLNVMKRAGFKNSEISTKLKPYTKKLLKVMPAGKLARVLPGVKYAMAAYAVLNFANNPAQALADELGCSPEAAQAILNGNVTVRLDALWNPGTEVDTAQLTDGNSLSVGDYVYAYEREPVWGGVGPLRWAKHVRITKITLRDTPGKVTVHVDDGTELGRNFTLDAVAEVGADVMEQAEHID